MSTDKKALRVKELKIGRMPGFSSGMAPYKDFSPNINIISGPNASGKSTTARAIQKLIWQNDTRQLQMSGNAEIGEEPWSIQVDSDHIEVKRKGMADEMAGIPPSEHQNRYMLALHELIHDEGEGLAQRIIKESIGGYDPEKAAETLSYSETVRNTRITQFSDFKDAEKAVRDIKNQQKEIKEDEQRLADLYKQRDEASEASRKAEFYERVTGYLKAKNKCSELHSLRQEFPEVLEHAHGEEFRRVEEIEEEIREAEAKITNAEEIREESSRQLNNLDIPENGVKSVHLTELESRVESVSGLEKEIGNLESGRARLEKKRDEATGKIGDDTDTSGWDGLNLREVGELGQFLEKAQRISGEKRFAEKEITELEKELSSGNADKEALNRGIETLGLWLKEVPEGQAFPYWAVIAIVILSVLSITAGYFIPMAGLAGLIAILVITVFGLIQLLSKNRDIISETRVKDYKDTGLKPPGSWNPEDVQTRLDELIGESTDARWQGRIRQKIELRSERIAEIGRQIREVEQEAALMKEKLSALPKLPFGDSVSYSELAWFVKSVQHWQDVNDELLGVNEELEKKRARYHEELEKISGIAGRYSPELVSDAATANAVYKELRRQEDLRKKAVDEIRRQEAEINAQKDFIRKRQKSLQEIYGKLDVPLGEKDGLRTLTNQLNEYREVVKNCENADHHLKQLENSMQGHTLFADEGETIDNLTVGQAEELQQKFSEDAKRLDEIKGEITEIEVNIDNIKKHRSLELALKNRDEKVQDLKQVYEDNLSSITGRMLVDKLKGQMREQNRPKVFKVANRLFNRITNGRYELEINEKGQPVFMAHDTVENSWRTLDELSSGTRIQLLMVVRLAFVETQESSLKLPILADELLANSDGQRAAAIIEALTEISRDGRQVFYFTAQADEVGKWKSYLSANGGVDYKVFELSGDSSGGDISWEDSEFVNFGISQDVPAADTHEKLGEELDLPGYNPLVNEPGQLHLWYLVDDVEILRECLGQRISRWGNLKSFLEHGGEIKGLDDETIAELNEKAELLDKFNRYYRQGRAKPIDAKVLEESGAVSSNFIRDVSVKLAELNGNPAELLTALKNGEVSGFRANKIEELETYLLAKYFIDIRDPLSPEEIRTVLQAFISNLNLSQEKANLFLGRLYG